MKRKSNRNLSIFSGNWPLVYTASVLFIGLIVAAGIIYVLLVREEIPTEVQLSMLVAVIMVIIALTVCFGILRMRGEARSLLRSYESLKETHLKTSGLNDKLREQRHDFLNHIQIIHSLIEMNEYKEAASYMEEIYNEIQSVGKILKTASPAINALLQVKNNSCESRGIEFKIVSTTRLDKPAMEPWDICGILGNLIDNAIHAAEAVDNGSIRVSLKEDIKNYIFKVKDNGKGIPDKLADRVFTMGFTTKSGEGHGIGLAVSKRKLESTGGSISFETGGNGTEFTFTVPKAS
ncbi:MAG: Spo0B domain-containing protein [Clostridia bacterium]|nr:Spo0B domain-containing protein [Clostridia bacterium]